METVTFPMKRMFFCTIPMAAIFFLIWSADSNRVNAKPPVTQNPVDQAPRNTLKSALETFEKAVPWKSESPRKEIRPRFESIISGNDLFLNITHDHRKGLDGYWKKTFSIEGGKYYRFVVFRKTKDVKIPRRSAFSRLVWQDNQGKLVENDHKDMPKNLKATWPARARAEHPLDKKTDALGWTEVSGTWRAPKDATQVVVELHLQWAPNGSIQWKNPVLQQAKKPEKRIVRLATIHYQPKGGKTNLEKCKLFEPFIAKAALQKADLVVLPETLTLYGSKKKPHEVAEPIPGPSTQYFGTLAKKHDLYLVVGLNEKAKHLVYNVAVLIGPDGKIAGKYRKVTLPRDEVADGVAPGEKYPVFKTRFGKVGMMICYDGFFPEVARRLSNNGAEVIAFPVWGCNPKLATARALENHVYVVSSTYTDSKHDWMISAIYGHTGKVLAQAKEWGSVAITEVDLNRTTQWRSLGDFRAHKERHRPASITD